MDTEELGAFLRSRRERLRPEDVGMPSGTRRRTPGLRREEVAVLAHISTEYYIRLEQARAPRPSGEVLGAVAAALRLTAAETDHLHVLAGAAPPTAGLHRRDVRPSILTLLERLPGTAGLVLSAAFEVLACNALAAALMEDFSALDPDERNLARRAFLGPVPRPRSTASRTWWSSASTSSWTCTARSPGTRTTLRCTVSSTTSDAATPTSPGCGRDETSAHPGC